MTHPKNQPLQGYAAHSLGPATRRNEYTNTCFYFCFQKHKGRKKGKEIRENLLGNHGLCFVFILFGLVWFGKHPLFFSQNITI